MPSDELEWTYRRIREAHTQEDRGRMPSTTNLVSGAACLTSVPLVDSLHRGTWGLRKLSRLTQSKEGRDSMRRPMASPARNQAEVAAR